MRAPLIARAKRFALRRFGPRVASRQPARIDIPLGHWNLDVGPSNSMRLGQFDLRAVAEKFGTPLFVIDGERLGAAASSALYPHRAGAGADLFFSYKTNPVPAALRCLHQAGVGAEVISEYELWLAFELGVPGSRIVYNGPAKSVNSIEQAIDNDVFMINANSAGDMQRIVAVAERMQKVVNLGLRVATSGSWGGQFGIPLASPQMRGAINAACESPYVDLRGLHVHRGGTVRSETEWRAHVTEVVDACEHVATHHGWRPSVLDVGGSLACASSDEVPHRQFRLNRALGTDLLPPDRAECLSVADASRIAHDVVESRFGAHRLPLLVQEPGRALTGDTQMLLLSVVDIKDDTDPPHVVLDGGRNICDPLPHEYHQFLSVDHPGASADRSYRLVGPICSPADILCYSWRLPTLAVGDVLAVMDTGAYFVPFSTSFSFPQPAIVMLDRTGAREVRARERFEDVVRRDLRTDHGATDSA